jgi:phosphotransferase system enzyme I (PtsI)
MDGEMQPVHIEDVQAECERFDLARGSAKVQLEEIHKKMKKQNLSLHAQVFQMHQMILEDVGYIKEIKDFIRTQLVSAQYAVSMVMEKYSNQLLGLEDMYLRERATDVKDVSLRVMDALNGIEQEALQLEEETILVVDDLTPSELIHLQRSKVVGIAIRYGSHQSHTSILAKGMQLPMVVGLGEYLSVQDDGKLALLDGGCGHVYVEPSVQVLEKFRQQMHQKIQWTKQFYEWIGKESITQSGRKVGVLANINSFEEVDLAIQHDADGIGLFRSECLYLQYGRMPTFEEQLEVYEALLRKMQGKRVVVRTLDLGMDKGEGDVGVQEANPALGCRGIRESLLHPEEFSVQLKALYRAARLGPIGILFPMITSLSEVYQIKQMVLQVQKELELQGVAFGEQVELGLMIETPAAVMLAQQLAKEVDFLSIGSNDLTQYTLALDRTNAQMERYFDPYHPAVLEMIRLAVRGVHAAGKRIGICGELGADLKVTQELLGMEIDEFSVIPSQVLPLRKKIAECE